MVPMGDPRITETMATSIAAIEQRMHRETAAWLVYSLGVAAAVAAAYVKGGLFEALSAISAACVPAAGLLGWGSRTPPAPK